MASTWGEFLKQVEDPSPGEVVVAATIRWFNDVLQVASPLLAEGYTESLVAEKLPNELPVQACIRRVLRAVDSVAQARRNAQATGLTSSSQASTQALAKMLAPGKAADVANLLDRAGLKHATFGLQAEQVL